MGEAKRRGTREERVEQAKNDPAKVKRRKAESRAKRFLRWIKGIGGV